jgi:hypothetical protein
MQPIRCYFTVKTDYSYIFDFLTVYFGQSINFRLGFFQKGHL